MGNKQLGLCLVLISGLIIVLFQNFATQRILDPAVVVLNPRELLEVDHTDYPSRLGYKIPNSSMTPHELKFEAPAINSQYPSRGRAVKPIIMSTSSSTVPYFFKFEAYSDANTSKVRSEIRVVGSDLYYDNIAYVNFRLYLPEDSSLAGPRDYSIFWQCAQITEVDEALAPPISLQIRRNSRNQAEVYLVTMSDYSSTANPPVTRQTITPTGVVMARNAWTRLTFRFRLGAHGHFQLWKNGQSVGPALSTAIGYKNVETSKCSSRFGLYRRGGSQYSALHYVDSFKFGPSWEDIR